MPDARVSSSVSVASPRERRHHVACEASPAGTQSRHGRRATPFPAASFPRVYRFARCSLAHLGGDAIGVGAGGRLHAAPRSTGELPSRGTPGPGGCPTKGMDPGMAPVRICRREEAALSDSRKLDHGIHREARGPLRFRDACRAKTMRQGARGASQAEYARR